MTGRMGEFKSVIPPNDPLKLFLDRLNKIEDPEPQQLLEEFSFMLNTVHSIFLSFLCATDRAGLAGFSEQFHKMMLEAKTKIESKEATDVSTATTRTATIGAEYFGGALHHTVPALIKGATQMGISLGGKERNKPATTLNVNLAVLVRGLTLQAMMPMGRTRLLELQDEVPVDIKDTVMGNLFAMTIGDKTSVLEAHETVIQLTMRATMMERVRALKDRV